MLAVGEGAARNARSGLAALHALPPCCLNRLISTCTPLFAHDVDLGGGRPRRGTAFDSTPKAAAPPASPDQSSGGGDPGAEPPLHNPKPYISQKVRFIDKLRMEVQGGSGGSGSVSLMPKGARKPQGRGCMLSDAHMLLKFISFSRDVACRCDIVSSALCSRQSFEPETCSRD